MEMCTATCALSAILQTFLWFGVYFWTIFGLRTSILGRSAAYNEPAASRRLQLTHILLSYGVIISAFIVGIMAGTMLAEPPVAYGLGILVVTGICNSFNGLFEIATGVCPIYGVILKRHHKQLYLRHPRVRILGLARLLVSGLLLAVAVLLVVLL